LCRLKILNEDESEYSTLVVYSFDHTTIQGAEVVEALTAGTGAEALAEAFTWIESGFPAHMAQNMLLTTRIRATVLHSSTTPAEQFMITAAAAGAVEVATTTYPLPLYM
jgi:Ni/Fe-hydrogenase subunit HybB-like protein